ncbi:MAG: beta-1,3-glucosyltransferase [Bacteroidetes bacterium 24-39-8]|nr:MAG: beta-1,3-glucosyltransferase [Bacteroidetes bacterium 24-39-8]OZA63118.1 MAG: beta-1,3-glucosyltransferase [Sphingobacteriia bacterium 39-39-8]HQR91699.1 glycoside hydrolase family 3 N-terminal domain-containing protein [Sediminibacterium sp.]HQS56084.1 glycoside hydrolase family 3 N-terminal domain-containing protein [Sediminibacterium sp.]
MKYLFSLLFISLVIWGQAQLPAYKNSQLPTEQRVKDLLGRMTAEEKFWQLFMIPGSIEKGDETKYQHGIFGFQVSAVANNGDASQQMMQYGKSETAVALAKKINAIQRQLVEHTRLGIPMIAFDEALHGLVRNDATVFPQAIALAASWDTSLVSKVANAIADEAAIRGIRQILSPVINLATDPRWGRTEETYGEDPFLTSAIGDAFMGAFERKNIITTPKHFIANVGAGGKDSYPIHDNERLFNETHFRPFVSAFRNAGSRSVMTSYNSIDGSPASANDWLLNKTLKDKWGFRGFVISDASAVGGATVLHNTAKDYAESGKQAIFAGLDVIFQTAWEHHKLFIPPFLDGSIPTSVIDSAVARVLTAKFQLGLFEQPYVSENDLTDQQKKAHQVLAQKAAMESVVLLKNEAAILPFKNNIKSIAVIGEDAQEARLGGYSGPGTNRINLIKGLEARAGKAVKINYAKGSTRLFNNLETIPTKYLYHLQGKDTIHGLLGSYFNNIDLSGEPELKRNDQTINFRWTLYPPDSKLNLDFYSVTWEGLLISPINGFFDLGLIGNDGFRLYINGELKIDQWNKTGFSTKLVNLIVKSGESYPIKIEFKEPNANAHIQLVWRVLDQQKSDFSSALELARKSDLIVFNAGIEEGEFRDRAKLSLPGNQEPLLAELFKIGKPVVVLLTGGSAITMQPWLNKASAVLDLWYAGEQTGSAVAAILFGDANPSGKLPIGFPLSEGQLPYVYNHLPTGRGDDYNDLTGKPLFPFGYGLSYTQFEYSQLQLEKTSMKATDSIWVQCQIKNIGQFDGAEIVQLYIRDQLASLARPVMELKGFQKLFLKKGASTTVKFLIKAEQLSMLDEQLNTVVEPGDFRIMIGASSNDLRLKGTITIVQ